VIQSDTLPTVLSLIHAAVVGGKLKWVRGPRNEPDRCILRVYGVDGSSLFLTETALIVHEESSHSRTCEVGIKDEPLLFAAVKAAMEAGKLTAAEAMVEGLRRLAGQEVVSS
jgi:hypothetical protein